MIKFSSLLTLLALVVFVQSCSDTVSTPALQTDSHVLMPLAFGNKWMARYSGSDTLGGTQTTKPDSIYLVTHGPRNGQTWSFDTRGVAYRNDSSGLWSASYGPAGEVIGKYPCAVGDTFSTYRTTEFSGSGNQQDSILSYYKVLSTSKPVTVPAGSFSCYEYETFLLQGNGSPLSADIYVEHTVQDYALDKGLIRSESFFEDGHGNRQPISLWELTSYSLN